jgi:hypothetical protein
MPVSVKVGGAWKAAAAVYNKVGGVWKTASDMPVKIGGVWKTGILASGAYEPIATATVTTSGVRTLNFSSIPSGYSSLQVRGIVRVTAPSETSMRSMLIKLNNSTTTTGAYHWLTGNGTSATASANSGGTSIYADVLIPTGADANPTYGAFTMDLIDYASTTKNKTMRMFFGGNHSGYSADNVIWLQSALWISTSAVNRLTFDSPSFDFVVGSTFSLYGIKGA